MTTSEEIADFIKTGFIPADKVKDFEPFVQAMNARMEVVQRESLPWSTRSVISAIRSVSEFKRELAELMRRYDMDQLMQTPDSVLAEYVLGILGGYRAAKEQAEHARRGAEDGEFEIR